MTNALTSKFVAFEYPLEALSYLLVAVKLITYPVMATADAAEVMWHINGSQLI